MASIVWLPCKKSYVSFVNEPESHMCDLSMYHKSMCLKSMSHNVSAGFFLALSGKVLALEVLV